MGLSTEVEVLTDFIYVPSINLYVAKQISLFNTNWFDCHKELQKNKKRMLIIPEFIEFLKYLKSSANQEYQNLYKEITEVRLPWRAERLDADFKLKNGGLYINYNHKLDKQNCLVPKTSELLDSNTLMQDKTPGISLEDWLENPSRQGLPTKDFKKGNLYYLHPRKEISSATRFDADSHAAGFFCDGIPFGRHPYLGVRAVKEGEKLIY